MSHLSVDEMKRYDLLTAQAKHRPLTPTETLEWRDFGERYAVQLEDERQAHLARRKADQEEWLAEKRAYDDAVDEHRKLVATTEGPVTVFDRQPVERDFPTWLKLKGRA